MLVGMGTVFVFLTILVFGMSLMSAIALKMTTAPPSNDASEEQIAAITVALAQHRKKTAN